VIFRLKHQIFQSIIAGGDGDADGRHCLNGEDRFCIKQAQFSQEKT